MTQWRSALLAFCDLAVIMLHLVRVANGTESYNVTILLCGAGSIAGRDILTKE